MTAFTRSWTRRRSVPGLSPFRTQPRLSSSVRVAGDPTGARKGEGGLERNQRRCALLGLIQIQGRDDGNAPASGSSRSGFATVPAAQNSACHWGKRRRSCEVLPSDAWFRAIEETDANRTPDCCLRNVDAYNLTGSRRGCAKVRHVESSVWTEGHPSRNHEASSDILDATVSLDPHNFAGTGGRITSGI